MKFRFRKHRSEHDGQIGVRVETSDDDAYEAEAVIYFDSVGIIVDRIEARALSAAITAAASRLE